MTPSRPKRSLFEALRSKDAVIETLRRAGVAPETITGLQHELPDPVDLDRDGDLLLAYEMTMDRLIDPIRKPVGRNRPSAGRID